MSTQPRDRIFLNLFLKTALIVSSTTGLTRFDQRFGFDLAFTVAVVDDASLPLST